MEKVLRNRTGAAVATKLLLRDGETGESELKKTQKEIGGGGTMAEERVPFPTPLGKKRMVGREARSGPGWCSLQEEDIRELSRATGCVSPLRRKRNN